MAWEMCSKWLNENMFLTVWAIGAAFVFGPSRIKLIGLGRGKQWMGIIWIGLRYFHMLIQMCFVCGKIEVPIQ